MGSDRAVLIEVPIGPGLGPPDPRPFSPQALPHLWGFGGAGAPGQGRGSCPAPKGLALDLGWPPHRLVGREGLGLWWVALDLGIIWEGWLATDFCPHTIRLGIGSLRLSWGYPWGGHGRQP
jgi:hypothetical protein